MVSIILNDSLNIITKSWATQTKKHVHIVLLMNDSLEGIYVGVGVSAYRLIQHMLHCDSFTGLSSEVGGKQAVWWPESSK